jgi:hypothetical protein
MLNLCRLLLEQNRIAESEPIAAALLEKAGSRPDVQQLHRELEAARGQK